MEIYSLVIAAAGTLENHPTLQEKNKKQNYMYPQFQIKLL